MNYNDYRGFNLNETLFPVKDYGFKVTRSFWKGENRKKHYALTAGMVDDLLDSTSKHDLPIADFTTMKEFCCVIADFDILPPQYDSFEQFHYDLFRLCPQGCQVVSASGKVKVIFLVSKYKNINYANTLKSLIPTELHEYLDLNHSALTTTYLTVNMIKEIQTWLKTAIPQEPVLKEFTEIKCEELADEYKVVSEEIVASLHLAGFNTKNFRCLTDDRLSKLAFLLISDSLGLCNEGVVWNQGVFAKVLGLKSPRTAAKILQALQDNDFISMTCNYSAGNKSRTYIATGGLRSILESHGLHLEAHEKPTVNQHKINQIISELLPPSFDANKYYMIITKRLLKCGLTPELCAKILYDIDQRRPSYKQRKRSYFSYLAKWQERKIA